MSSIFGKLLTALRGGAREAGEAVMDANATRIYTQEIEDAKKNLGKAKRDLTNIMASQTKGARDVKQLQEDISKYETAALSAAEKNEEELALSCAEKVGELQTELVTQEQVLAQTAAQVGKLKGLIKQSETTIREHERELKMVKTTESVQKATQSITNTQHAGANKLLDAKSSLDRIKARQQHSFDQMDAAETLENEMGSGSLDDKLAQAGIGGNKNSASDILAKLKQGANKS